MDPRIHGLKCPVCMNYIFDFEDGEVYWKTNKGNTLVTIKTYHKDCLARGNGNHAND